MLGILGWVHATIADQFQEGFGGGVGFRLEEFGFDVEELKGNILPRLLRRSIRRD